VQGIARSGGGSAEFIAPGERIEPKVVRLFTRLLTPALTEVQMDWGGLSVVAAPSQVPPIFAGARLVLYGLIERTQPATLRLHAKTPMGPVSFDVPLDPQSAVPGTLVSILAARARIRELEESPAWLSAHGSRQQRSRGSGPSREIVELAVRYSLISRETSFVAVERRDQPVVGDVQLRRIPIALTSGWGGLEQRSRRRMAAVAATALPAPAASYGELSDAMALRSMPSPTATVHGLLSRMAGLLPGRHTPVSDDRPGGLSVPDPGISTGPRHPRTEADGVRAKMLALVSLQRADGAWDLTDDFARAIGQPLDKLQLAQAGAFGDADEVSRAWATALALHWLNANAAVLNVEWRMIAAKARQWLDRLSERPASGRNWVDEAARVLQT
jgi:Ca-activated chloride channel family protein